MKMLISLLVQYLPLYNDQQKRRQEVRPGLFSLAQVSGRSAISVGTINLN